jgi:hypothetical protein
MRSGMLLILLCLVLLGCKEQYKFFIDDNGREHCQNLKDGQFVPMGYCGL